MVNLSAAVLAHAVRSPNRMAVVYDDQRITYAELADRVARLAGWMAARGVGDGDVVALFMKNSAAFLEAVLAASHLGAVFLPLNYRLSREEAAYIVDHAAARLLLADAEFASIVETIAPQVHLFDPAAQRDSRTLSGRAGPVAQRTPRRPADLFRLMYTSGTTDRPKGVPHTYDNFHWKNVDQMIALSLTASDRTLIVGPMYHVGGMETPGICLLWLGGMLVIQRDFAPEDVFAAIERERITCAWFAPVMTARLVAAPRDRDYDLGSMRWVAGGGDRTPEPVIRAIPGLFPNADYIDLFGLTETCGSDTLMEPGLALAKIGSTGRPVAHAEIRIADPFGDTLPADTEGEICIRGPKVTSGYYKDPERTAESFFGDWFRTGDVGRLDGDGFLYVTGRKKDMIVSGGENIAAGEVERVLCQLPEIDEAAVLGLPDAAWGERPVAVVVPREGATLDYPALAAHCRQHLAGFKIPRELHLRDALPRNPSGKVLKRILRAELMGEGAD